MLKQGFSEGSVILALNQPFGFELLGDGRPFVFTFQKFFPMFLGLFPRNQFPKRGDVEHNTVVQVGFEVEISDTPELILKIIQFRDQLFLSLDFAL